MVRAPIETMLRSACATAAEREGWTLPEPLGFVIEAPRDPALGDAASNLALGLARPLGLPPMAIAGAIASALPEGQTVAEVQVARPGFLNFRLTPGFLRTAMAEGLNRLEPDPSSDRCLKLAALAADHVSEAIATGRVPPRPADWTDEDQAALTFQVLARPGERIDPAVVRREVLDNPWYFVRQALDRTASVLTSASAEGLHPAHDMKVVPDAQEERQLWVLVAGAEGELALAIERGTPQRLARAAVELASGFYRYYGHYRVFGEDHAVAEARLTVIAGVRNRLLDLLAPIEAAAIAKK